MTAATRNGAAIADPSPSRSKPDRGLLTSRVEVRVAGGEAVMTMTALNMIRRRPDAAG